MIITIIIILVILFKVNDYLISVFGLLWIFPLLPKGVWAQSGDGQAWSSEKWPSSKSGGMERGWGLGGAHPSWNEGPGQPPNTDHTRQLPALPLSSVVHGPLGSTQKPSLGTVLRNPLLPFPASLSCQSMLLPHSHSHFPPLGEEGDPGAVGHNALLSVPSLLLRPSVRICSSLPQRGLASQDVGPHVPPSPERQVSANSNAVSI